MEERGPGDWTVGIRSEGGEVGIVGSTAIDPDLALELKI